MNACIRETRQSDRGKDKSERRNQGIAGLPVGDNTMSGISEEGEEEEPCNICVRFFAN